MLIDLLTLGDTDRLALMDADLLMLGLTEGLTLGDRDTDGLTLGLTEAEILRLADGDIDKDALGDRDRLTDGEILGLIDADGRDTYSTITPTADVLLLLVEFLYSTSAPMLVMRS